MAVLSPPALTTKVSFYASPVGKKVVMAITGFIWVFYVIAHLLGNLQVYLGPEVFNAYARALREAPALLWTARIIFLVSLLVHITTAFQLWRLNRFARPTGYVRKDWVAANYASRTMILSGPIILAFVIYHLLHLTFGTVHPQFEEGNVYANVVIGFQSVPVVFFYSIGVILLGFHLYHGIWSMFQSVGFDHPKYTPALKKLSHVLAVLIVLGYLSIPTSVQLGLIR